MDPDVLIATFRVGCLVGVATDRNERYLCPARM